MESGIYKIRSKLKPERIYIGSAVNIKKRWSFHLNDLKNKEHHSAKLQNHFNKYGLEDLEFFIIQYCSKEDLIKYEQSYLDLLNPYFNICKIAGSSLGIKLSEETKQKMRDSHIGMKGHKHSDETKQKIRKSREKYKGNNHPGYGGHSNKGKHWKLSEETKQKIRESIKKRGGHSGENNPMYGRKRKIIDDERRIYG